MIQVGSMAHVHGESFMTCMLFQETDGQLKFATSAYGRLIILPLNRRVCIIPWYYTPASVPWGRYTYVAVFFFFIYFRSGMSFLGAFRNAFARNNDLSWSALPRMSPSAFPYTNLGSASAAISCECNAFRRENRSVRVAAFSSESASRRAYGTNECVETPSAQGPQKDSTARTEVIRLIRRKDHCSSVGASVGLFSLSFCRSNNTHV